jgi:hypothetical protein
MVEMIHKWKECAQEECTYDSTWCANIDDNTMVDEIIPVLQKLIKLAVTLGFMDLEIADVVNSVLKRCGGYLSESMANTLDKCTAPPVDRHNAASMHGNISCDIAKQSYLHATTETSFNNTIMLSLVFVVFSCFILMVGDFESFHLHLSVVRVGCCIVGLLMSSLVYVGSWHMYTGIILIPAWLGLNTFNLHSVFAQRIIIYTCTPRVNTASTGQLSSYLSFFSCFSQGQKGLRSRKSHENRSHTSHMHGKKTNDDRSSGGIGGGMPHEQPHRQ